ncbi:MAG: hypothetical protein Q7U04_11245, partial [Bacteriovorax sp.]|nr:hypothetical protein [Bacteriovorax sp.]
MKKIERLFLVFPILILFFIMVNLIWFFEKHTWQSIGSLLFFTYLFPVFCARVVLKIWPIKEGGSIFGGGRGFSSWLILHRIQLI